MWRLETEAEIVLSIPRALLPARRVNPVFEVRADPPSDDPVQLGDIVLKCAPDPLVVDAVIRVFNDDSHALDLGPGQLARQLCRDVAETSHGRLAREAERSLAVPTILAESDQLGDSVDRFS